MFILISVFVCVCVSVIYTHECVSKCVGGGVGMCEYVCVCV